MRKEASFVPTEKIETPDLEKSQEVLRKLQEIEEVELCNPTEKRIPGIISILMFVF